VTSAPHTAEHRPDPTPPVYLQHPRYVLGERTVRHDELPDLADRAAGFGMPLQASLWGWGQVHCARSGLRGLAVAAGRETLTGADVIPSTVDGLVLCSTRFPGGADVHGDLVADVVTGLGMSDVATVGITLNRCTNFLTGLDVARAMVASGSRRRVLVVTTDKVPDGATRVESFALFSDGAASCLVTADAPGTGGYLLLGCATVQDARTSSWSEEIQPGLARRVNDRLLGEHGLEVGDLDGLLHANLLRPVVTLKERQAGFARDQLFTDNIERVGHCFAADPLINLADRAVAGALTAGRYYLLASSVPGSRVGALITPLSAA